MDAIDEDVRYTLGLAQDSVASDLQDRMNAFGRKWSKRLDRLGLKLADRFARATDNHSQAQINAMFRSAGWTVRRSLTAAQQRVLEAVIGENVSLIRDLGMRQVDQITQALLRSLETGGKGLSQSSADIQRITGVTRRRAIFIARDQSRHAEAMLSRQRQLDMGVTEAIWKHSHGGHTPRPEHVAFNGHRYEVAKGAYLEGKWVWPGSEINCRCYPTIIIPGLEA